jgi:hyperosmotically inducible periplasmic protein
MFRALFKLLVLMIVLVAVGGFFLGWWGGSDLPNRDAVTSAAQTGAERAKQAGQEISQKTAEVAKTAQDALSDGALTGKIKAKMALDDSVKALDLNVDTVGGVVTVTGNVRSSAERERALALARETNGVVRVVDRTTIEARR